MSSVTASTAPPALPAAQLHHTCDPHQFDFQTTAELEDLGDLIGQMRAMEAVQFGTGMRHEGYNIYVQGPSGMGKRSMVRQWPARKTPTEADPPEWCYLHNFKQPHKPQALSLPPGRGADLRDQMAKLVDYMTCSLGTACCSACQPKVDRSSAVRSACGALLPGGVSVGTCTRACRKRTSSSKWASIH